MNKPNGSSDVDWSEAVSVLRGRFESLIEEAAGALREIVQWGCAAVGSAESSLMVPDEDGVHLKFLVSVNRALESEDLLVPIDRSIAGYVFTAGDLIAVGDVGEEMSDRHFEGVDERTGTRTRAYLAVPVMQEDVPSAVLTFVNRPKEAPNLRFSPEEIEIAQRLGSLCAVGLTFYRNLLRQSRSALTELARSERETDQEEGGAGISESPLSRVW